MRDHFFFPFFPPFLAAGLLALPAFLAAFGFLATAFFGALTFFGATISIKNYYKIIAQFFINVQLF